MRIAYLIRNTDTYIETMEVVRSLGIACDRYPSESTLLKSLRIEYYDMILMDSEKLDQELVCSWLGCRSKDTPVVILSADYTAEQTAMMLEAGAEDVIRTTLETVELRARLQTALRRYRKQGSRGELNVLDFKLDRDSRQLYDRGTSVKLNPREFTLANMFLSSPGVFLSTERISMAIWGVDGEVSKHTIEQHVYRLRKKLDLYSNRGARIRTEYNRGYCFEVTAQEEAAA